MRELSPQRKKVVVLGAAIACMAGVPMMFKNHPVLLGLWVGLMVVALVKLLAEFAKLKRNEP
jgi:hypothetical protein